MPLKTKFYNTDVDQPLFLQGSSKTIQRKLKPYSKEAIKRFLTQQNVYSLHKPTRKFIRNKYYVNISNQLWQIDLIDFQHLSAYNDGYKYILVCIDVFSKYLRVRLLRNKTNTEVLNKFKNILDSAGEKPQRISCDRGLEFTNRNFKSFLNKSHIQLEHPLTSNPSKSAVVERVIRTIKDKINRLFTLLGNNKPKRYIDYLDKIVNMYNSTYHSSIKMQPKNVNNSNTLQVYENLYGKERKEAHKNPLLSVNDYVRVKLKRNVFEKASYHTNWSDEVFKIFKIYHYKFPMYSLIDLSGKLLRGKYYEAELQKIYVSKNTPVRIIKKDFFNTTSKNKFYVETSDGRKKWMDIDPPPNSLTSKDDIVRQLFPSTNRGGITSRRVV